MSTRLMFISALLACLLSFSNLFAQDKIPQPKKNKFLHNIFKRVVSSVTTSKQDSTIKATVLTNEIERSYTDFEGKIIRKISIKELGFEKVFTATM